VPIDKNSESILNFSLKTILITMIGIFLFIGYVNILINGENSLTVLTKLKKQKKMLINEKKMLKKDNQYLQKAFFQLKDLEAKE